MLLAKLIGGIKLPSLRGSIACPDYRERSNLIIRRDCFVPRNDANTFNFINFKLIPSYEKNILLFNPASFKDEIFKKVSENHLFNSCFGCDDGYFR